MGKKTLAKDDAGSAATRGDNRIGLTTARGLIVPADWNEKGEVVGLVLSSYDEREYRIEMQDKGIELFKFVRKGVEVTGSIDEKEGKKIFNVKKYTLEEV